jgi:hypothetical protein
VTQEFKATYIDQTDGSIHLITKLPLFDSEIDEVYVFNFDNHLPIEKMKFVKHSPGKRILVCSHDGTELQIKNAPNDTAKGFYELSPIMAIMEHTDKGTVRVNFDNLTSFKSRITTDFISQSLAWTAAQANFYRVHGELPGTVHIEFMNANLMSWEEYDILEKNEIEMIIDRIFRRITVYCGNNRVISFPYSHTNEINCLGYEFESEMFGRNYEQKYRIYTDKNEIKTWDLRTGKLASTHKGNYKFNPDEFEFLTVFRDNIIVRNEGKVMVVKFITDSFIHVQPYQEVWDSLVFKESDFVVQKLINLSEDASKLFWNMDGEIGCSTLKDYNSGKPKSEILLNTEFKMPKEFTSRIYADQT